VINDGAGLFQVSDTVAAQAGKCLVFPAIGYLLFSWKK